MANTGLTVGAWFPTGFHGHFRSKTRLDFINEYRHLSKPTPPKAFVSRAKLKPTYNIFSKHDNRHSFANNAIYFEGGLGRRRFKSVNQPQPDLLAWMPEKKEWEKPAAQHSVYRLNFRESPRNSIKELITKRPKTSFDDDIPAMTTYRYSHGNSNPNRGVLNAMANTSLTTISNRRITTQGSGRESVAHCLNWHTPPANSGPSRPNRPAVCPATEPVILVPHPPANPRATAPQATPSGAKTTSTIVNPAPTVTFQLPSAPPLPAPSSSTKIVVTE